MKDSGGLFRSKLYADLGGAWRDLRNASGTKDTSAQAAKFAGKAAWNTVVLAGEFGVKFLKEAPTRLEETKKRVAKSVPTRNIGD